MRMRSKEIRIAVAVSDFVKLDLVNNPTLIMFSLIKCKFILRVNLVGGKAMVKRADIFHSNLMCICIFVFVFVFMYLSLLLCICICICVFEYVCICICEFCQREIQCRAWV